MTNFVTYVSCEDDFVPTNKIEEDQVVFVVDLEKKVIYAWHGKTRRRSSNIRLARPPPSASPGCTTLVSERRSSRQGVEPPVVAGEMRKVDRRPGCDPAGVRRTSPPRRSGRRQQWAAIAPPCRGHDLAPVPAAR